MKTMSTKKGNQPRGPLKPATASAKKATPTKSTVTTSTASTTGKKRKATSTKQDTNDDTTTSTTTPTPAKKVKGTATAQTEETKTAPTTQTKVTSTKSATKTNTKPSTPTETTASPKPKATPASKKKATTTTTTASPAPITKTTSKSASSTPVITKTKPQPKSKATPATKKITTSVEQNDDGDDEDMSPAPQKATKKQDTRTLQQKIEQRAMAMDEDDDDDSDDESDDYSDLDMNSDGEFPLDTEQIRVLDQMEQKINANLAKAQAETVVPKKPNAKNAPGADESRGVIYLGHIPYGFFEDQMSGFFSQFGTVTRLRLARNKKSGRSKHYAFIEFESDEVADIVASSMNNYMMFGHTLVCERVPTDRVHPNTFDGANTKFHVIPWKRIAKQQHNKDRTAKQHHKRIHRLIKKADAKHATLKALNIDYSINGYKEQLPVKATRKSLL